MDKTPPPLSAAAARALKLPEGRLSAEIFRNGDLEIRFYAPPNPDPDTPNPEAIRHSSAVDPE